MPHRAAGKRAEIGKEKSHRMPHGVQEGSTGRRIGIAAVPGSSGSAKRRILDDGSAGEMLRFAGLLAVFLVAAAIAIADKLERVGTPNIGWMMDSGYVSPTRADVSDAGLRGGGGVISINGVPVLHKQRGVIWAKAVRAEDGAVNTLRWRAPHGAERELAIEVRPWAWRDVVFTEGATDVIALLFFIVGVGTFVLRPWESSSWALLILCTIAGASMLLMFLPIGFDTHYWSTMYYLAVVGFAVYMPFHTALAFPVPHPVLLRHRRILWLIYGLGTLQAVLGIVAWRRGFVGPLGWVRGFGAAALLLAILFIVGRAAHDAWRSRDPLVAQRARILLAGAVIGLVPFPLAQFLQQAFGVLAIDNRFVVWPFGIFVLALARVTLRQELMNARIAVRRAVMYAGAVLILTVVAWLLTAVRPYAVAALLFPLLYFWPRFEERLNRRLYPQRARFPELLREIGDEMATSGDVDEVLALLAEAPRRLCDAVGSTAFLLADVAGVEERVHTSAGVVVAERALADELLIRLMSTTRKEILRSQIAVEPLYSNVQAECYAGFDRLGAVLLLPLVHQQRVVGGLAVGARASGDVYERAEIDALSNAAQQGVQAVMRIVATERLRARELKFADLKRFFPPQVIDQVMARGDGAELRSQRKLVTIVFADLRGFTAFSEVSEPEEVMATLAEYHAAMGRRIAEYGGTLEHFAGDGFLVFFNDPVEQPDHAERAVRMALDMRSDIEPLREAWLHRGYRIHLGIGIATGYATCGFVGYEGRRDYGVIGNVTNLAARLSDAAAPGEILISGRVQDELGNGFRAEPVGELTLKGFQQAHRAYRLVAHEAGAAA